MGLSKEINKLVNLTVTERDPEDQFNFDHRSDASNDDDSSDDSLKDSYVSVAPGRLRRANVGVLRDKKYAGQSVDRRKAFDDDDDSKEDDDSVENDGIANGIDKNEIHNDDEEEEGDDDDDDEFYFDDGDEEEVENDDKEEVGDRLMQDYDDDEGEYDDEGDDDEEEEEGYDDMLMQGDDDDDEIDDEAGFDVLGDVFNTATGAKPPAEYKPPILDSNEPEELTKGKAVNAQLEVWDALLELRIQFQKCLAAANRCPDPDAYGEFSKAVTSRAGDVTLKKAKAGVSRLFNDLLYLRDLMVSRYPEIKRAVGSAGGAAKKNADGDDEIPSDDDDEEIDSDCASGAEDKPEVGKKRKSTSTSGNELPVKKIVKVDDGVKDVQQFFDKFRKYRNGVIDKWHFRTKMTTGKLKKNEASSASNQTIVEHIEQILKDRQRIVDRSRTKRSAYRILGRPADQPQKSGELEPNIYDDDDFYHFLLREIIDRRTANTTDSDDITRQWIQIHKLRTNTRKVYEQGIKKSRKLRYDVVPKLVGYMSREDTVTFTDEAIDELFASLFGKRSADTTFEIPKDGPSLFSNGR